MISLTMHRLFIITSSLLVQFIASSTAFVVDKASSIDAAKIQKQMNIVDYTSNACCASYPYCSCPKLDKNKRRAKIHQIKLPAAAKKQSSNYECCSSYPYCGCPKLETSVMGKTKRLPFFNQANINACCSDFPHCNCPKLETASVVSTLLETESDGL